MREMYWAMDSGEYCILREETVRERRGSYNRFCCRLYPFICWIIIKEGPGNFSGGRSPHCNIPLWRTYQTYSLRTLARK
jgi:hypothetical protein